MGRKQKPNDAAVAAGGADASGAASSSSSPTAAVLPWGMATKEMQPSSLTSLTDDKLARFVIGHQKKTKFEKDREEREARKRQADEEAAKIYAKFVASFEDEDETLGKAFVRGETVVQGTSQQQQQYGRGDEHQRGELYRLKPKDDAFSVSFGSSRSGPMASSAAARPGKKLSEMDRMLEEMKQKDAERQHRREQHQAAAGSDGVGPPKKKRREIDQFLEELKEREPVAPTLDEMGLGKGSFDHGDPDTTNLYVGNLAPTVTEEALEALFGKYGEIYSVKIMWPRTEEERARKRNCGFVSFYDRRDADEARVNMHDKELESQAMVVGWGKAVKIDMSARIAARAAAAPPPPPPPVVLATLTDGTQLEAGGSSTGEATRMRIQVELPTDPGVRERVDRLAQYVAKDGVQFENAIRLREGNAKEFGFLFESPQQQSALATYYRWRVYAFAMGDEDDSWREAPFQMTVDGPVWVPPAMPFSSRKHRRARSRSRSRSRRMRSSSSRQEERSSRESRKRSYSRSSSSSRERSSSPESRSRERSRRSASSHRRGSSRSRSRDERSRHHHRRSSSRSRSRGGRRYRSRSPGEHRRHDDDDDDDSRSDDSSSRSSSSSRHRRHSRSRSRGRRRESRRSRDRSRERALRSSDHALERERAARLEKDMKLLTGQQIARARDIERGRERSRLLDTEYDELKDLLESLTLERESVKKTMGFALDHSEAAVDIVNVILKAFKKPNVSAVAMVGYLYVTSDILHNSSAAVKNASLFRTTFQDCLPEIIDVLRRAHKALVGRMSANAMKEKVLSVLTAWESWSLFPPMFLVGLNATFLRKVEKDEAQAIDTTTKDSDGDEERLRKACRQAGILSTGDAKQLLNRLQWLQEFTAPKTPAGAQQSSIASSKPGAESAVTESSAAQSVTSATSADPSRLDADSGSTVDDIDGEPIDDVQDEDGEDLDGEPIDGDDADLDGQPLDEQEEEEEEDENVDGEPLDDSEDLDGEPLDESHEEDADGEDLSM